jgi:N-acetyl-gamma-glutamyl-phosphate reductase
MAKVLIEGGAGTTGSPLCEHPSEILRHSDLRRWPVFIPSVESSWQGMLVRLPLRLNLMPGRPAARPPRSSKTRWAGTVRAVPGQVPPAAFAGRIDALALNDSNRMKLSVFANEAHRQGVLVAHLDKPGKDASGAAMQNRRLMLGL